jgi:peroxiredoxin/outer membrane lipoprotein-sorting protein
VLSRTLALCLLAAVLAAGAAARADRKSEALLKKVRKATEDARTFQADAEVTASGGGKSQTFQVAMRLMKPNFASVRFTGVPNGPRALISTGTTLFQVREAEKAYFSMPAPPVGESLGVLGPFAPDTLFFAPQNLPQPDGTRHAGELKLHGTKYEVLEVATKDPPQTVKYYVGPSGLVEGVDVLFRDPAGDQAVTMVLKNVRVNAPLTEQDFAYSPPEEFRHQAPGPAAGLLPPGKEAPDFQLPRPGGGRLALSEARKGKKAVLVSFWFYRCDACRASFPQIQKLYDELKEKGLEVVTVNAGDSEEVVQEYFRENSYTFPVVMGGRGNEYTLGRAYGVGAYPTNYLLDGDGKVVMAVLGFPELSIRTALERMGVR